MSIELVFCIGLALLILAVAGFTIVAKETLPLSSGLSSTGCCCRSPG